MVTTQEKLEKVKEDLISLTTDRKEHTKKYQEMGREISALKKEVIKLNQTLEMEEELERTSRFKSKFKVGDRVIHDGMGTGVIYKVHNYDYTMKLDGGKGHSGDVKNPELKGIISDNYWYVDDEDLVLDPKAEFKAFGLMIETEEEAKTLFTALFRDENDSKLSEINFSMFNSLCDTLDKQNIDYTDW